MGSNERFLQIICPACGHDTFEFFEVVYKDECICEDVVSDTIRRCANCKTQIVCIGEIEPEFRKEVPKFEWVELI